MQKCILDISGKSLTLGSETISKWKFLDNALHFKSNASEEPTIFLDEDYKLIKWIVAIVRDQRAVTYMPQNGEFIQVINHLLDKYPVSLTDAKYEKVMIKDNRIKLRRKWIRLPILDNVFACMELIKVPENTKEIMFNSTYSKSICFKIEAWHTVFFERNDKKYFAVCKIEVSLKPKQKKIFKGSELMKMLGCLITIQNRTIGRYAMPRVKVLLK